MIALSTTVGMLINFTRINPIDALFATSGIDGFLTPPIPVPLMLASSDRAIMRGVVVGRRMRRRRRRPVPPAPNDAA